MQEHKEQISTLFGLHSTVFLAVAQQGSLSAAATVLGMHPSSLSYHLGELEKMLGFQLLDRHQKPSRLTPEGRILYDELQHETRKIREVISSLRSASALKPIVRFGIVESLGNSLGVTYLKFFNPKASKLSLITGTSERLFSKLKDRSIDWAIASRLPEDTDLTAVPLFQEPSVLIAPLNLHLDSANITWESLRFCGLPFLHYSRQSGGKKITDTLLNALDMQLPARIEVDSGGVMLELVRGGIGWSFVRPATLIQHPTLRRELQILPMPAPLLIRQLNLVVRSGEVGSLPSDVRETAQHFFREELCPQILRIAPWLANFYGSIEKPHTGESLQEATNLPIGSDLI